MTTITVRSKSFPVPPAAQRCLSLLSEFELACARLHFVTMAERDYEWLDMPEGIRSIDLWREVFRAIQVSRLSLKKRREPAPIDR